MSARIFIHGLDSSNKGTKAVYFRDRYPDMIVPHFTGALEQRMQALAEILGPEHDILIVGSSFGGLMATLYAREHPDHIRRMILLAPALNLLAPLGDPAPAVSCPVLIYHGTEDRVIPLTEVEALAPRLFGDLAFHRVEDDHFLHRTFPRLDWDRLLAL